MKILINDVIQYSDAPDALKSPALADKYTTSSFVITLAATETVNCIGVGNTDATTITVNGDAITLDTDEDERNGLYVLTTSLSTNTLTVSHDGTYLGRFGAGQWRFLGASKQREPGFYTTMRPRATASGQVIEPAGGVSGKEIGLDFRYKIDRDIFTDFRTSYQTQVARGYPFFLFFDKETHRMPYTRLYGSTDNKILFQSATNFFLYSRRFTFTERF